MGSDTGRIQKVVGKNKDAPEKNGEKDQSLFQRIQNMSLTEKIQLGMKGDREARTILIRDSNKMIQLAVINNPRITESEVVNIAHSRNVKEEVLRKIANTKEWTKLYQVRVALVNNPKTPIAVALRFISTLMTNDLKSLATSKSVPSAIRTAARRLTLRR